MCFNCDTDSSVDTPYKDSTGIDLEDFIKKTLNKTPKDRSMLIKLEVDLIKFIREPKWVNGPLIGFGFKHIYFSSIVKQIFATYINRFRVRFLEPTSTGVIWRNMVVTRLGLKHMIPGLRGRHLNH
jgi:hypothetical protein